MGYALNGQAHTLSREDIQQGALAFLQQQLPDPELNIRIHPLDHRLPLKACEEPLEYFIKKTGRAGEIHHVGVRCRQPAWLTYISVDLQKPAMVALAATHLPKGHLIAPQDITWQKVDLRSQGDSLFTQETPPIGWETHRHVAQGQLIRAKDLGPATLIHKGEAVQIEAKVGQLSVLDKGIALQAGTMGQNIAVLNAQSRKQIYAKVVGKQMVAIMLENDSSKGENGR